ncbi:MAG: gliding motility-associated C-terminal domain-containing protein [Bacteroidota bacterium]
MKKIFYILLLFGAQRHWCQNITPQVINSAGGHQAIGTTNASVTYNVGEPFIETVAGGNGNNLKISQGFIQPEAVSSNQFSVTAFVTNLYCSGKNDGRISTAINTTALNYGVAYYWKPASLCPGNNCPSLDSLQAGTYSLTVVFTYTNLAGAAQDVTVQVSPTPTTVADPVSRTLTVKDENGPCQLKVFTGITINGDGINDHLYIENVSEFPNNTVTIFNRWGKQLYQEKGYDNLTKFWPRPDEADKLLPSTYFYVIDPGEGSKVMKGWIEIIKN